MIEALLIVGLLAIVAGIAWLSMPLGLIVLGLFLAMTALGLTLSARRDQAAVKKGPSPTKDSPAPAAASQGA